jgi:nucleotide-binding universal stress UspA family protein
VAQATARGGNAIKRILVCLDGSPYGQAGLRYAVSIAKGSRAKPYLLEVLDHPREGHPRPVDTLGAEIARADASDYLNEIARQMLEMGLEAHTRVVEGHPAEQILRVAEGEDVDLIVMATHGSREATHFRLGATTQNVARHSRRSLLLVRPEQESPVSLDCSIDRILVFLDGSSSAEAAMPPARRLAMGLGAELILCHAGVRPMLPVAEPLTRRDHELLHALEQRTLELGRSYLRGLQHSLVDDDIRARYLVEGVDDIRQGAIDIAERERADLVLLASHGQTSCPSATHGSLVEHLISYASKPVWVVQNRPEIVETSRPVEHERVLRLHASLVRSSHGRHHDEPA